MRVWLYARLSGDDDPAQNSLQNQQEICRAFAEKRGDTIVGCSSDDNVSGMSFSRILAKIVIPQALRSSVLPMTNLFIAVMLTTALGSQVPLKPQELTGVVSYINTRSLGGVAAFFISALGYLGTAFVVSHIGNYIDKKVRILR